MSSIPAKAFVNVNPGVLNAGGNALITNGIVLTTNGRVPIGQVLSFPSAAGVDSYFGPASKEAQIAGGGAGLGTGYFGGFENATQIPSAMLVTQYNPAAVAAYLRGGPVDTLSIPQLAALSGSLTIVMDGYTYTNASVSLSGATSYSAAAALIQTAINNSLPAGATVTGAIAPTTASVTGSIAGNVLYVTAVGSGVLVPGAILTGTGVSAGTKIDSQISGTTGGVGSYAVSIMQVTPSTTVGATYGTLTVASVASGTLSIGQTLSGSSVTAGTQITALGTGVGLTGTYFVSPSQTTASTTITATGSALAVTYDSVAGAFVITAGARGPQSTSTFATGTLAGPIFLTQTTGAVLSQGAAPATPSAFMNAVTTTTQNWVSFMTAFDPDDGQGNVQKQAFAGWVNGTNDRYVYVCFDTDITPTQSTNATTSLGQILAASDSSGTFLIWEPSDYNYAAFVCGMIAAINYSVTNGRITLAYKGQTGLVATVTDQTTFENLAANGYNCYCDVATANQQFVFLQEGVISGPFEWADSYVDQIVLNNALQLALMELLANINSLPYNDYGYGQITQAMADPIAAALNSGIIRKGVTLSALQTLLINNAAGGNVAPSVQQQGYAIVIQPASPQTRQARQSPGCFLWYTDGESVQYINLSSILVQ